MGIVARIPDFVACEEQRRRPACAAAKSDQHLCYSLSEMNHIQSVPMLISGF